MRKKTLYIILLSLIIITGCTNPRYNPTPGQGSFETIFTDPDGYEETLERVLELIDAADNSIYLACYGLDLTDISEALINAHNNDIQVRVVCDNSSYSSDPSYCFRDMQNQGIEIAYDYDDNISHNKTIIIDSSIVWTGSTNFTYNGFFLNNNNVIIINSSEVAEAYIDDFSQMFSGYFHGNKTSNGIEEITVADGYVEVLFGPQDNPASKIIERIEEAQSSIVFCIYAFTMEEIASALISAFQRGITVHGIFDEGTIHDSPTQYYNLVDAGVDVRIDPCPYAFHHKFMVIDKDGENPIVITGSGNWSYSGSYYNDENFLIIHSGTIAETYYEEFLRWWDITNFFAYSELQ